MNLRKAGLTHQEIDSALHGRAVKTQGLPYTPQPLLEQRLEARTEGTSTWLEWVLESQATEQIRRTTVNSWSGNLKHLSDWIGAEDLAGASKKDAVHYKSHLLQ